MNIQPILSVDHKYNPFDASMEMSISISIYIFQHKEREFVLKFSAMEIYNEAVRDLLISDTSPLRLLDDPEVISLF